MKKQPTKAIDQFGLEGDGIIENFFHLLWTKDPLFGTIPSVYVPHTVIFRYSQPIAWYFMSSGALKKKTKKNMNHDHIKEVFLRNKSASGIVAVFMRYTNEDSNDEQNVVFEYFSEKEFVTFIEERWNMKNGVLQQFVQPKGEKNYIIKANWSPKLCLFEKIEALTKINDPKFDIYDRALTFEAQKYHSKEGPLRGYVLPNKIQRICANIAQHVQNVTFESITLARMMLHFKLDESNRIWFLLCTSLRTDQGPNSNKVQTKINIKGEEVIMNYKPEDYLSKIKMPENIKTNIIKGKPVNMHKIYECINCTNKMEPDSVFETTYKTIIEGYEWDHLREKDRYKANQVKKANPDKLEEDIFEANMSNDNENRVYDDKVTSLVPPLIKKIFPRLKDETYRVLRNDIAFLKKTALFCEECILSIQQSQENNLRAQKQTQNDFYGTGRLKPESIKFRFVHTEKTIHEKTGNGSKLNFMKFRPQSESKFPFVQSARNSDQRTPLGFPGAFNDLKSLKTIKSDENTFSDSEAIANSEAFYQGGISGTTARIGDSDFKTLRLKSQNTKKDGLKHSHSLSIKNHSQVLGLVTPNNKLLEQLTKTENALGTTGGFMSAKAFRSRQNSNIGEDRDFLESRTSRDQNMTPRLFGSLPKKRFLETEYKTKRVFGSPRDLDEVDMLFENVEVQQKPEMFAPFKR